jgi:hypothetical protein
MTDIENLEIEELEKKQKKRLWIGRILSSISLLMSLTVGIWLAYLLPITNSLSEQGRMNEGDSDGCFYGLLFVLTIFISPIVTFVALILGGFGFHLKARTLAIIAWIAALATLIPIWPALTSFFGS